MRRKGRGPRGRGARGLGRQLAVKLGDAVLVLVAPAAAAAAGAVRGGARRKGRGGQGEVTDYWLFQHSLIFF